MTQEIILLMDKIRNAEGIKCINRMKYHNDCISILNGNFTELSKALLHFEDFKNALELMDQNNYEASEKYQNEISRLLHNFLASAMMLVDQTRLLINQNYTGTEIHRLYAKKIKAEFKEDGLNKFIQELRNYILHRGLPYTGLSLKPDLKTTVFLNRDAMLEWDSWTAPSRKFLSSQKEKIRIYDFIHAYTKKILALNHWLNLEIKKYHAKDLEELEQLRSRYREISKDPI